MNRIIGTFKALIDRNTYRIFEIDADESLYDLASMILKSYDFDMDHAFGFYNNVRSYRRSTEIYELFADDESEEYEGYGPVIKGVSDYIIGDIFAPKQQMMFLFDYGDEWLFRITCQQYSSGLPDVLYPRIIKEVGSAPKQYPVHEES